MAGARAGAGGERRREGGHGQVPGPLQTTHHRGRAPGLIACCSRACLLMSAAVRVLPCAGLHGCECRRSSLLCRLTSRASSQVVWCGVLCKRRCASSHSKLLLHLQRSYNDRILQVQEENARLHQSLQRAQHTCQQEEAATQARIQSVRDECERKVKKVIYIPVCVYVCVWCMYVCMYVCVYTHTHTRTYTHTHTHTHTYIYVYYIYV